MCQTCVGGCSCTSNSSILPIGPTGATGSTGATGAAGANGTDGIFGGFSGRWLFSTATTNNPVATQLRYNNVLASATTEIYIHKTNANSLDLSTFLASFTNSNRFGLIRVFDELDSTKFHYFRVTGLSLAGNVTTLTVTYIGGNGSTLTDTNNVILSFQANSLGATSIDYVFQDNTNPYISNNATAVKYGAYFVYEGTNYYGVVPNTISIVTKLTNPLVVGTGYATIYDVTNSNTIGQVTLINTNTLTIRDLSSITNIPSGRAIFYIAFQMTVADNTLELYSLNFKF